MKTPSATGEDRQSLIAAYLAEHAERPAPVEAAAIPRRRRDAATPLSFAQEQVWVHAQLAPDVPLYSEPITIHRSGPLEVGALEHALAEVLRRHEAWRTTFAVEDGRPVQVIRPACPVALPVVDLRKVPAAERETEALLLATGEALRPFDLEHGPLLRATLVQLDDEEHRLFLTLHHIIFDGVSIYRVLLPELIALYDAFTAGRPSPLGEPAIQYGDWAVWQRDPAVRRTTGAQLEYWKRVMTPLPAPLALPTDHPYPAEPGFRGAFETFDLGAALSGALRDLARREGVTLFMTLLAAFAALLHRYTGQDDLVVGTVTAGRKRPEVESLLGFFLNPLALRTDLGGDPPFREALRRVRDVTLDALDHDDVPFAEIVAALEPQRAGGRHPLFQVMFSMEPPLPPLADGWRLTQLDVEPGVAKFDLYVEVDERADGIIGRFVYRTDLFAPATAARMAAHYRTLLEGIVANAGTRLSALPLLTETERRRILGEWAEIRAPYPRRAVHRVFEAQAARTPEAVAIVAEGAPLTYRELNRRANRLARRLVRAGVVPGAPVGICLERSPGMVVAMLAVLKAGGGYVPLDAGYPEERLAFMLRDSGAVALIADGRTLPALPHERPLVVLPTEGDGDGDDDLPVESGPEALAYVMFTSGSTGRPKGVAIPHEGIVRLVFGQTHARFGPAEVWLHLASVCFDASTLELWAALLHGARCVLFPGAVPTHDALGRVLREGGVTSMWLTASLFNAVIDGAPHVLRGVRQLLVGGEALSVDHVRRAQALLPGTRIINGYGPTECTTFTNCHPISGPVPAGARSIPIGRPIANTRVRILDRHGAPVPVGVPGELHAGGPGLALGYVNRPELTAEKFVPDPWSPEPGARLYRTGDLARWLPDGTVDFLGRLDAQVKIRGFRVEPGEVEAVLGEHSGVRQVAVVPREDRGDRVLVAYVLPGGGRPAVSDLRTYLQAKLPPHMIPSTFVLLDALPLTPSGKIDRGALPAPDRRGDTGGRGRVMPRSPLEWQLAEIWEELLGVPEVGRADDFFELGGHSLLAVRMMQRLDQIYGKTLPLAALYGHSTLERLAAALVAQERESLERPVITLNPGGRRRPFVFFHGDLYGGGFYSLKLARLLGAEQPMHLVQPLGLAGGPLPAGIEAMAEAHVRALRAVQPYGPYRLGGYCNGGLVAYEVASRLERAGEEVELLALIVAAADTRLRLARPLFGSLARLLGHSPAEARDWFGRLRLFAYVLRQVPPRARLRFTAAKALGFARGVAGWREASAATDGDTTPGDDARWVALLDHYVRAVMAYIPPRIAAPVIAFWPEDEPCHIPPDPTLGWGRLTGATEVYLVPGTHGTVVTRHVHVIAGHLRRLL